MCDIHLNTKLISENEARAKMNSISFRGPDFSGIFAVDRLMICHNRLAIVDLDSRSNQPFFMNMWQ